MKHTSKMFALLICGPLLGLAGLVSSPSPATASEPPDIGAMLKVYERKMAWSHDLLPIKERRPWLNPARAAL